MSQQLWFDQVEFWNLFLQICIYLFILQIGIGKAYSVVNYFNECGFLKQYCVEFTAISLSLINDDKVNKMCMCVYMCMSVYLSSGVYMHLCAHMCSYVYIFTFIVCECMCVCVCMHSSTDSTISMFLTSWIYVE